MDIIYKETKEISALDLSRVFERSELKRPFKDMDRLERMIEHADIIITAWIDDQMVGVARAITDYSYCCYLSDLAVDKDYQKLGIGKSLVEQLQRKLGEEVSLFLLSSPTAVDFYPRIGFNSTDKAFLIPRQK
jgi:N-acetylglutamate synthase-like GNAT family acetyltransferase